MKKFFDYSPIDKENKTHPQHIYRNFSWGKDMDPFFWMHTHTGQK